ncbi:hypothetical protein DL98DRAFT_615652 [Cadophora sp. DSE1049]|nr:hypothetical protein DL98DRAFT_615652 [Cadophora sp. DSE1049]
MPRGGRSVTINFYRVKAAFRARLIALLEDSVPEFETAEAEDYTELDPESRRPSLYENYSKRGHRLAGLCFYEYASQIYVQNSAAAARRTMCFPFDDTHPQHATYVQVSASSIEALATPSLCGSFTRLQEPDSSVLPSTSRTQDEIDETLLGLFYPWDRLPSEFQQDGLRDLRASEYKNTYIWTLVLKSLPSYLVHLSQNVLLLRRSKEAADKDRKERGIEFNDYLETSDDGTYNGDEVNNIDLDFSALLPIQHHLLQAALDVRGHVSHGSSRLRILPRPVNASTQFCDSAMVKAWGKELQPSLGHDSEAEICDSTASLCTADESACLIPSLHLLPLPKASLPTLRAIFRATPTVDSVLSLIESQHQLNSKQQLIVRALFDRILHPILIRTARDQFLLYLGGVGGDEACAAVLDPDSVRPGFAPHTSLSGSGVGRGVYAVVLEVLALWPFPFGILAAWPHYRSRAVVLGVPNLEPFPSGVQSQPTAADSLPAIG